MGRPFGSYEEAFEFDHKNHFEGEFKIEETRCGNFILVRRKKKILETLKSS